MAAYLALILHAHLPFVRHPEHEHFLEEEWFFEAITESYIPLLRMMRRLVDDSVPFKLTMSLTPTVCADVFIGRDVCADLFGAEPSGFWLPECACAPGLEAILQEANIRWFVLDAHGLLFGKPRPRRSIYAPCYTPSGPVAFARDCDS